MRTWATKLVVEPSRTSPIREWLQDQLDQCGFDGNLTSRYVFSLIDHKQSSSPALRIGLCQTGSVFSAEMDGCGRQLSSMAVHNRSCFSGRRSNSVASDNVDHDQESEVMEVLRMMASPEV
jgi:hypothetical protein